jgi:hypothetical protein
MTRLTVEERRRMNELRRTTAVGRQPRAIAAESFPGAGTDWARSARVASLITIVIGAALVIMQLAETLSLYGPGSLLDWLLPRL